MALYSACMADYHRTWELWIRYEPFTVHRRSHMKDLFVTWCGQILKTSIHGLWVLAALAGCSVRKLQERFVCCGFQRRASQLNASHSLITSIISHLWPVRTSWFRKGTSTCFPIMTSLLCGRHQTTAIVAEMLRPSWKFGIPKTFRHGTSRSSMQCRIRRGLAPDEQVLIWRAAVVDILCNARKTEAEECMQCKLLSWRGFRCFSQSCCMYALTFHHP